MMFWGAQLYISQPSPTMGRHLICCALCISLYLQLAMEMGFSVLYFNLVQDLKLSHFDDFQSTVSRPSFPFGQKKMNPKVE